MSLGRVSKSDKWSSDDVKVTENVDFNSLLLSEKLLEGLKNCGFEKPSPVQLQAIPLGRCGMDLIVQAKSGTGKTVVLAVVALDTLVESPGTQVLILAPTREIAFQICGVIRSLGCAFRDLTCEVFIGGLPLSNDMKNLPNCQIVVGTPGRIKQLISLNCLKTDSIRLFVVDEADRLFDKHFQGETNWIFSSLPSRKQTVALSATYPDELAEFLSLNMTSPASVRINSKDPSLLGITQYFHITPFHPLPHINDNSKFCVLLDILNSVPFSQCMVFCQKQTKTQDLADDLVMKGFPAVGICSALDQSLRLEIIHGLKDFQYRVLVSTDLTARGIDAENVNLVVNFDLPYEGEVYLHRIGCAGRYGTRGMSISLISDKDELTRLKLFHKKFILKIYQLPDPIPPDLWVRSVTLQARRIEELGSKSSSSLESSDFANGKSDTTVHENPSECELDGSPEKNDSATFVKHSERSVCNEAVRSSNEEKCSSSETSVAIINEEKQLVSSGKIFKSTVDVGSRVIDDQVPSQKQDELQDTKVAKTTQDGELQVVGSGDVETGTTVVCEEFVQVTQDNNMLHNLYEGNSTLSSSEMVALPPASCSSPKDNSPPKVKQASSGLFPEEIPKVNSQGVRRKDKSKECASHQERKLQKQRGNSLHASKILSSKQSSVNENAMTERSSSLTQQNGKMGRKPQMFFASNYTSVHPQVAKVNVDCRESRKGKTRKSKRECSFQNHRESEVNSASLNCGVVAADIDYRQIGKVKSMKSQGENSFRDCHEDEINSTDLEDVDADIDHRKIKSSKSKYKHSYHSCPIQKINSAYVNKNPVHYAPSYFSHADFHGECDFRSSSKHNTSSYYLTSPCNPRAFGLPYDCCCEMLRAQPRGFYCHPFVQYYKKYLEY